MSNRDSVYIALFAAVVVVLGLLPPIPVSFIPVPITARSLGVMLAGSLLGAKRGGLALLLFLVLLAIGIPQAGDGSTGLGVFFGPRGGFLLAFPLAAYTTGLLVERFGRRLNLFSAFLCNVIGGVGVVYAIGLPWLALMAGPNAALGATIFLPGDLIKVGLAALTAVAVRRSYPLIWE